MSSRNSRSSHRSGSISKAKKLIKRKLPPSAISDGSESEMDPVPERSSSRMSVPDEAYLRSASTEPDTDYSDYYEEYEDPPARGKLNESERDLMARLELARKNSQNQHEAQYDGGRDVHVEETIYESEWDDVSRPESRASRASQSSRNRELPGIPMEDQRQSRSSIPPRPSSTTPTRASEAEGSGHSRASSLQPPPRKLHGPRSPSPSSRPRTPQTTLPSMDDELAQEDAVMHSEHEHVPETPRRTTQPSLPRSKRQPFEQGSRMDATTPRPTTYDEESGEPRSVEPLVIRRKSSMQFHGRRKHGQRTPSMTKASSRRSSSSLRQGSSTVKHARSATTVPLVDVHEEAKHIVALTDDTKKQLTSIGGRVQRIKDEYERMLSSKDIPIMIPSSPTTSDVERIASPTKMLKTPPRIPVATPKTKEAQERMDEMFRLLKNRRGIAPGLSETSVSRSGSPAPFASKSVDDLSAQLETELSKATQNQDTIQVKLQSLTDLLMAKSAELERTRAELQNAKLQKDVIKRLYDDSMAEKEIMYEAFNEELDMMFQSVQQPGDDGWKAMSEELHRAKITAKTLEKEKAMLQHQLADADVVMEELRSLLRVHGLIP
ncbi:hypothetical protein NM688_g7324 [Phlebia brevispora]|uniref:Uncharacterized protein n=1 Tax=Phlebia brevispora TaxID=194682 RepID=A0ACC1S6L2_9APHY|nr:hypothetical protein NM688_g7324 [Phlebia brevispora]